jgi:hypothetical protein
MADEASRAILCYTRIVRTHLESSVIARSVVPPVIGLTERSVLFIVPVATLRRWAARGTTPPAA